MEGLRQRLFQRAISQATPLDEKVTVHPPVDNAQRFAEKKIRVGIIGGGITGLYAAYLFKKHYGEKVEYTILERDERIGGRILTYKFPKRDFPDIIDEEERKKEKERANDEFQYGEVGAMRIPSKHKKVVDLIDELQVPKLKFLFEDKEKTYVYVNGKKHKDGKIMTRSYVDDNPGEIGFVKITTVMENEEGNRNFITPMDFNEVELKLKREIKPEHIPRWVSVKSIYDELYGELKQDLVKYGADAFFEKYDGYSVYNYFHETIRKWYDDDCVPPKPKKPDEVLPKYHQIQGLIDSVLHYSEMLNSATGLNHLALVESVLDSAHFESKDKDKDKDKEMLWWTIDKGMYQLPEALCKKVKEGGEVIMGANVFEVKKHEKNNTITVRYKEKNDDKELTFDRIIVTVPFGSVRLINFVTPFSYGKAQAIRSLNYDQSTKIFVQFPSRWWEKEKLLIRGGASLTDLPIHTVVYPSYAVNSENYGVLLASYTWQTDAILWGDVNDKDLMKQIVLRDLAILHNRKPFDKEEQEKIAVYSHTWLEAFALFRPGQFKLMINGMIPENGIHFAGEHLSNYHAWILGSLSSATRAVAEVLLLGGNVTDTWEKLFKNTTDAEREFDEKTWEAYTKLFLNN